MARILYDAVTTSNVPASATLVAGYGDGYYNNIAAFRARFPHATIVEIAVSAKDQLGTVLDVENGDATPTEAPGWARLRRAVGGIPTVYCNSSTWPLVREAFQQAGIEQPEYWIAQYDGSQSIPAGAVAKQYADPGPYDLSSVADYWPGVDPIVEVDMTPAQAQQLADVHQAVFVASIKSQIDGVEHTLGQHTAATNLMAYATKTEVASLAAQVNTISVAVQALAKKLGV